jgi:hypothetical protein
VHDQWNAGNTGYGIPERNGERAHIDDRRPKAAHKANTTQ